MKGIDEEVRNMPDMEKKLEQMDDNADELDFDDDDDDIPEIGSTIERTRTRKIILRLHFAEDHDEENGKNNGNDDLSDVSKLLKDDAIDKSKHVRREVFSRRRLYPRS